MEKELEINNKKLSPKGQEQLRMKIIRVAKKHLKPNGKVKVNKVAEICECSHAHVSGIWKKYCNGGIDAIKRVVMGRPLNTGALTQEQQREIQKILVDKCPKQLKFEGFLWDRVRICELVRRLYGIKLTVQGMGKYLKKWGFTPQRPIKRNYKQNTKEVQKWLTEEYPAIKEKAKSENAEITWCDETGCQNETNYVKSYAPAGKTPVLITGSDRLRINMISAINNQGKLRFMFYRESMNAKLMVKFMQRLLNDCPRKLYLIVDNLKSHHAKIVRAWLDRRKDKIELFFLPSYAPEYNPDEYLNGNLKREMAKKGYATTHEQLETNARGIMTSFQKSKNHVASFFQSKDVKYAS